jgi:hypothetical protein
VEIGLFFLGLSIILFTLYRVVSRKLATPQSIVRMLLRRYHAFERRGLAEQDCLYGILTSRGGWRNLPPSFVADLVTRLHSKETLFRFIALAEEHRFHRKRLPAIANNPDREQAMRAVALWLIDFGHPLQEEDRLKEAEFVQKLALDLQPDQYFTKLPLAATYFRMQRYTEAAPLLAQGLALLETSSDGAVPLKESKRRYQEMAAACANAAANPQNSAA